MVVVFLNGVLLSERLLPTAVISLRDCECWLLGFNALPDVWFFLSFFFGGFSSSVVYYETKLVLSVVHWLVSSRP